MKEQPAAEEQLPQHVPQMTSFDRRVGGETPSLAEPILARYHQQSPINLLFRFVSDELYVEARNLPVLMRRRATS